MKKKLFFLVLIGLVFSAGISAAQSRMKPPSRGAEKKSKESYKNALKKGTLKTLSNEPTHRPYTPVVNQKDIEAMAKVRETNGECLKDDGTLKPKEQTKSTVTMPAGSSDGGMSLRFTEDGPGFIIDTKDGYTTEENDGIENRSSTPLPILPPEALTPAQSDDDDSENGNTTREQGPALPEVDYLEKKQKRLKTAVQALKDTEDALASKANKKGKTGIKKRNSLRENVRKLREEIAQLKKEVSFPWVATTPAAIALHATVQEIAQRKTAFERELKTKEQELNKLKESNQEDFSEEQAKRELALHSEINVLQAALDKAITTEISKKEELKELNTLRSKEVWAEIKPFGNGTNASSDDTSCGKGLVKKGQPETFTETAPDNFVAPPAQHSFLGKSEPRVLPRHKHLFKRSSDSDVVDVAEPAAVVAIEELPAKEGYTGTKWSTGNDTDKYKGVEFAKESRDKKDVFLKAITQDNPDRITQKNQFSLIQKIDKKNELNEHMQKKVFPQLLMAKGLLQKNNGRKPEANTDATLRKKALEINSKRKVDALVRLSKGNEGSLKRTFENIAIYHGEEAATKAKEELEKATQVAEGLSPENFHLGIPQRDTQQLVIPTFQEIKDDAGNVVGYALPKRKRTVNDDGTISYAPCDDLHFGRLMTDLYANDAEYKKASEKERERTRIRKREIENGHITNGEIGTLKAEKTAITSSYEKALKDYHSLDPENTTPRKMREAETNLKDAGMALYSKGARLSAQIREREEFLSLRKEFVKESDELRTWW